MPPARTRSWFRRVITLALAGCAGSLLYAQHGQRTQDGHPDLQGMWLNGTATPLERPAALAARASLTDAEAREYEQRYQLDRTVALSRVDPAFELDVAGDLDTYEPGRLLPGNRTSMITDPSDGRLPALTPEGQQRMTDQTARIRTRYAENPENFPNAERCLVVANTASPPMMPAFYNNHVQIVQTRDYVLIHSEMIHDARIIPLDNRPHLPAGVGQWKGHSVGRWDGDVLVVETTNFSDRTTVRGSGPGLRLVERFSLADPDTLRYQFTIEDPASFVRPWSAESAMTRTDDEGLFEYACHEANYSLPTIMRGERFTEQGQTKQD